MGCKQCIVEHQEPRGDEPTQQWTPDTGNHHIGLSVDVVLSDAYVRDCVGIDPLANQPHSLHREHYLYKVSRSYKACTPRERTTDHQHDEPESNARQENRNSYHGPVL